MDSISVRTTNPDPLNAVASPEDQGKYMSLVGHQGSLMSQTISKTAHNIDGFYYLWFSCENIIELSM